MSFKTMADVRRANKAAGFFFFERKTMRFFRSRIVSGLYAGRYFISEERFAESPKDYTVREVAPNGNILTCLVRIERLEDAREAARNMAREVRK